MQAAVSRMVASPRMFNLVVSNVPGPAAPLWMAGCRLEAAFPFVPLADGHGVSVGITSIGGRACFGIYADPAIVPDAHVLASGIDEDLEALLAATEHRGRGRRFTRLAAVEEPVAPR
jgi:diacylglycerol O-acyltransferase / wax synthase